MKLKDFLRTLMGVRHKRQLVPPGEKPVVGSSIARSRLRICLKYPITDEQWQWFLQMGWRTVDMRHDRRRYTVCADKILVRLIKADSEQRDVLHARLVKAGEEKAKRSGKAEPLL